MIKVRPDIDAVLAVQTNEEGDLLCLYELSNGEWTVNSLPMDGKELWLCSELSLAEALRDFASLLEPIK